MGNVVDPAHNFAFEVHQYFDPDSSGTSSTAVGASIGSERIEAFQRWCRQNRFKAFLGEFAAGADATSLAALNDICRTLEANSDVWLGWAAWAGGAGGRRTTSSRWSLRKRTDASADAYLRGLCDTRQLSDPECAVQARPRVRLFASKYH